MPAGCHTGKIRFFPFIEKTDDRASSESWPSFRCLHMALIVKLMERARKWGLSIHLVSSAESQQKSGALGRTGLRFQGNEREKVLQILRSASLSLLGKSVLKFPRGRGGVYSGCWEVHRGKGKCEEEADICLFLVNGVKTSTRGPGHTLHFHGTNRISCLAKWVTGYWEHLGWVIAAFETEKRSRSAYLNYTHTRVQENGSFGLLGDLLVFVEVQIVRAVPELGQMEIPPLEWLKGKVQMVFKYEPLENKMQESVFG